MSEDKLVVVDTNIIFSALLKSDSSFMETLLTTQHKFHISELLIIEIFKHKEKLVEYSELAEAEIIKFYYLFLSRIHIFKEELISVGNWRTAFELCKDVDEADTPFVALTLEIDGLLWTNDKILKDGLRAKGFDKFFTPATPPASE